MILILYKKRKVAEIPTVRAELIHAPPVHEALPGETPVIEGATLLKPQVIVSEQLPTPTAQTQPTGETIPVPTLAPAPVTTQYQLPQAILSKTQRLELLQERFLKSEVDLETYKKLRAEIEAHNGKDITKD